jgi:hypothetical protein
MSRALKLRRTYCLDTGPLLDHLLLAFFEREGRQPPEPFSGKVKVLRNQSMKEEFSRFLQSRGPFVTSPGVFIELDRHVQDACAKQKRHDRTHSVEELPYVSNFREFLQQEFKRLRFEERLVPVEKLRLEELKRFGPVDASLMQLVREDRAMTLVTVDSALRGACLKYGLPCQSIPELLGEDTP